MIDHLLLFADTLLAICVMLMALMRVQGNAIARQCHLLHGVTSVLASSNAHPQGILAHGFQHAVGHGLASPDDLAVVIMRVGGRFSATTVQQVKIGDVLSPPRKEFAGVLA